MITIETLTEGIERVNLAFIENPDLDGNYRLMAAQYIASALLGALGGKADDFGFYTDPNVGYIGYISLGDATLFFAPTKAVVLRDSERSILGE